MWSALKRLAGGSDTERRVAPRIRSLGTVTVDRTDYQLENWSLSGILFSGHQDHLAKGQRFKLYVEVQDRDKLISFNAEAVVVRIAGDKLAAQFFMIEKHKKQAIKEFFQRNS